MSALKKLFPVNIALVLALIVSTMSLLAVPTESSAADRKAEATTQKAKRPVVATSQRAKRSASSTQRVKNRSSSRASAKKPVKVAAVRHVPARPSFGQIYGLHSTSDSLALGSSVALVMDQDTNEILFSKNSQAVLPIASITKLMTALVVTEANLPLDEMLSVSQDDVDTEKGSRSRLNVGTQLSRGEMLHLALMSSENRAAHALGRHYPGGMYAFVAAMNRKARDLGMARTSYVEPTGLSSKNQSSASDLAILVGAAHQHQIIRELSTSHETLVEVGNRQLQFRNTNGLVRSPTWDIGLQKTGYIVEAGRCLVMQARMAGRELIMVFLDSTGKHTRMGDAERVRKWMTHSLPVATPTEAPIKAAS